MEMRARDAVGRQLCVGGRTAQIHRSGEGGRDLEGLGGEVGSWGQGRGGDRGAPGWQDLMPELQAGLSSLAGLWLAAQSRTRGPLSSHQCHTTPRPIPSRQLCLSPVPRSSLQQGQSRGLEGQGSNWLWENSTVMRVWPAPRPLCPLPSCRPVEWRAHRIRGQIINQDTGAANLF